MPQATTADYEDGSASVTWSTTSDEGSPITSYTVVAVCPACGAPGGPPVPPAWATFPGTASSGTLTGLTPSGYYVQYEYFIYATNAAGNSSDGEVELLFPESGGTTGPSGGGSAAPTPPAPSPSPVTTTVPVPPAPAVALLSAGKLAAGRIPLHVACTQAACDGRAELILTVELRMRNKGRVVTRREALVLGSASYRLASGHSAVVEVPLSRQGLTALHDARHHKLTVSLRVSVAGGTTLVHRLVLIG